MSGTDSKNKSTGDRGGNVEMNEMERRLEYLREKTKNLEDALRAINESTPLHQPRKLEITGLLENGKNLFFQGKKMMEDVDSVSSDELADFTLKSDEFLQRYEEDRAGGDIETISNQTKKKISIAENVLLAFNEHIETLSHEKYENLFTPEMKARFEELKKSQAEVKTQLEDIKVLHEAAKDKEKIKETLKSAERLGRNLKDLYTDVLSLDTAVVFDVMMKLPEDAQIEPVKKKTESAVEQDKRIVLSILKNRWEKIQPERVENGAKFMDAIDYGRTSGGKIARLASELKSRFDESDRLFREMNEIVSGRKTVDDPNEVRNLIRSYDRAYLDMKMRLMDIDDEKEKRARVMMGEIQQVLDGKNEKFLTSRQDALMEGWLTVLRKKDTTNADVDEIKESFDYEIVRPLAIAKEKAAEDAAKQRIKEEAEDKLQREFEAKGEAMNRRVEEKAQAAAERVAQRAAKAAEAEKAAEPLDIPIDVDLSQINKVELKKGAQEMLREHGVVDLDPKQILDVFSQKELDFILASVRNDVKAKADGNRADFTRTMREAISTRLLEGLDKEKRDHLADAVTAQTYSLLRGAVEAEMSAEISRQQSGEMSKTAKAGKIGRSIFGNVALAAGVGVGAGLVIGSGGAAAAATGAVVAVARLANKRFKIGEKVESLYGKTIGRLFKKEKPLVDEDKILKETSEKVASKDILAGIISNQLRENSSKELVANMSAYVVGKKDAMRQPTDENLKKFAESFENSSRDFYKNAYNYVAVQYKDQGVSEEKLAKMALMIVKTLGVYQRGEVKTAQAAEAAGAKAPSPEDKNWLVDKTEKILKFRSEGVGAVLFGGAMAYGVKLDSTWARTISGIVAGAGLGLMVEKKTRLGAQEKAVKLVDEILTKAEKKLSGRDVFLDEGELEQLKKDSAEVRAQLDRGLLDKNMVLRNRAESFVVRVNKLAIESFETPKFTIDDLLKDTQKQSEQYEKESKKTAKKLEGMFKTKNRALVYMGVGAIVGAAAGYFGTQLQDYIKGPVAVKGIEPGEHDLGQPDTARYSGYEISPMEKAVPPTAMPVTEYAMEPERVLADTAKHAVRHTADNMAEQVASGQVAHGPAVEAVAGAAGRPVEVHAVYSSNLENVPAVLKDMSNATPEYLTREDQVHIDKLYNAGKYEDITEFISQARAKGQVFEDMKTGRQWHENELSFDGEAPAKAEEAMSDDEAMAFLGAEKKAVVPDAHITAEPVTPPAEPNMIDEEIAKMDLKKIITDKEDLDFMLKNLPEEKMTTANYHEMIDVYNKAGRELAVKYSHYVHSGQLDRAQGISELADTIGGKPSGGDIIDRELAKAGVSPAGQAETDYDRLIKNIPQRGDKSPIELPKEESITFDDADRVRGARPIVETAEAETPSEPPRHIDRDAEEAFSKKPMPGAKARTIDRDADDIFGKEKPVVKPEPAVEQITSETPKMTGAEQAVQEAKARLASMEAEAKLEGGDEAIGANEAGELSPEARQAIEDAKHRLEENNGPVAEDETFEVDEEDLHDKVSDLLDATKKQHLDQLTGENAVEARGAYDWLMAHKDNPKANALRVKFDADMMDDHKIKASLLKSVKTLQGKIEG